MLLFFAIESQHAELVVPAFDQGILLVVILTTSLVMTAALISKGSGLQPVPEHDLDSLPEAPPFFYVRWCALKATSRRLSTRRNARPGSRRISPTSPA